MARASFSSFSRFAPSSKGQLAGAVGERAEFDADQAHGATAIPMPVEKMLRGLEKQRIEMRRFRQRFCARDGLETRIANREGHGAGVQAGIAQALGGFLAEAAEHGVEHGAIGGIFAKGVAVRDGFGLGIDEKFVGILAARFAIERRAPLAEYALPGARGECRRAGRRVSIPRL